MWLTGLKIPTNQTMGKFSLGTMQDIKLYKKIIRILMSGGAVKNRILLARTKSAVFYRSHCFLSSAPRQPCLASPESVVDRSVFNLMCSGVLSHGPQDIHLCEKFPGMWRNSLQWPVLSYKMQT